MQYLAALTDRRFTGVKPIAPGVYHPIALNGASGPLTGLPPADRDLIYLAVRLALAERGAVTLKLPLVVDEPTYLVVAAHRALFVRMLKALAAQTQIVVRAFDAPPPGIVDHVAGPGWQPPWPPPAGPAAPSPARRATKPSVSPNRGSSRAAAPPLAEFPDPRRRARSRRLRGRTRRLRRGEAPPRRGRRRRLRIGHARQGPQGGARRPQHAARAGLEERALRFDVVAVTPAGRGRPPLIARIEGAFDASALD